MGEVHFRLLTRTVIMKKQKMKDLLLQVRVVVRTSNMKISRRRLADCVKKLNQKACRTWSTNFFLIQLIKAFVCGVDVAFVISIEIITPYCHRYAAFSLRRRCWNSLMVHPKYPTSVSEVNSKLELQTMLFSSACCINNAIGHLCYDVNWLQQPEPSRSQRIKNTNSTNDNNY